MFARRRSNRLSSTLEQILRIPSALMLHFFLSYSYIMRKLGENDDVFYARDRYLLNPQNPNSDHVDKLAFSLNKKFTDDVLFSHAHTLTGCLLDANNIIKFQGYRSLICCYPPLLSRETWLGMSMAFHLLSYVPGMHAVVFARSSSGTRALAPHPSTVSYCNILKGPSQAPTREP